VYGKLCKACPEVQEYKMYHAQSLYKSAMYDEASKAVSKLDETSAEMAGRIVSLQAAIAYEQGKLAECRAKLSQGHESDGDTVVNSACVLYKEGRYEEARGRFVDAINLLGYQPELAYNVALCLYSLKDYGGSLKYIAEIIERGCNEHPELSVGIGTEGGEVRSVGNTQILRETALVEAFNLKAAIEFVMGNLLGANEALTDMPPRSEAELDSVTLHNLGLMQMEEDPTAGFRKLNFLLQQGREGGSFPPETFINILLLYIKHQYDALLHCSHALPPLLLLMMMLLPSPPLLPITLQLPPLLLPLLLTLQRAGTTRSRRTSLRKTLTSSRSRCRRTSTSFSRRRS